MTFSQKMSEIYQIGWAAFMNLELRSSNPYVLDTGKQWTSGYDAAHAAWAKRFGNTIEKEKAMPKKLTVLEFHQNFTQALSLLDDGASTARETNLVLTKLARQAEKSGLGTSIAVPTIDELQARYDAAHPNDDYESSEEYEESYESSSC